MSNSIDEYSDPASYLTICRLGWPVMINKGAHTPFFLVDLYWIGALGTDAIAAVALCRNVMLWKCSAGNGGSFPAIRRGDAR